MNKDVIIITGPTASGKTKLARLIALSSGGEIIVADSMKVYEEADIGTSKPPKQYLKEINYHLLDIIKPDDRYDVGAFYRQSRDIIDRLHKNDILPVVVGGTPLYVSKLIEGLAEIPSLSKETKEQLDSMTTEEIYSRLKEVDPERAEKLHPNMRKRTSRALGVYIDRGEKMSKLLDDTEPPPYNFMKLYIDWPRDVLYERAEKRVDRMFDNGLVEEVKEILDRYSFDAPVFEGVGYRETALYLKGDMSLKEAAYEIKKHTRHYARKQLTWWRDRDLIRLSGTRLKEIGVL